MKSTTPPPPQHTYGRKSGAWETGFKPEKSNPHDMGGAEQTGSESAAAQSIKPVWSS